MSAPTNNRQDVEERLHAEIADLRAQLDQAHADGAVMRSALERIYNYPVHSEPVGGAWAMQDFAHDALSTNAGRDLLARYREALDLVNLARNVHPEAGDQMSPDWAARADTLLATVKGGGL